MIAILFQLNRFSFGVVLWCFWSLLKIVGIVAGLIGYIKAAELCSSVTIEARLNLNYSVSKTSTAAALR